MRSYRSFLLLPALMIALISPTSPSAAMNGGLEDDEPFRVSAELAPGVPLLPPISDMPTVGGGKRHPSLDRFDEPVKEREEGKKEGKGRTVIEKLSFTFSRATTEELRLDAVRGGEEGRALEKFRSLSSSFQRDSYRDAMESMGKIFEPQVNLRIEF